MKKIGIIDNLYSRFKKSENYTANQWKKMKSKVANEELYNVNDSSYSIKNERPLSLNIVVKPVTNGSTLGNNNGSKSKLKDICRIEDSPYYIHRLAVTDRLDEFKKVFNEDPTRLYLRDTKNWLPIHCATSKNRLRIIEFILQHTEPSMINETDAMGNTPMHIAIENGHLDVCKFLMSRNADTSLRNKSLCSLMHQCVIYSRLEILEYLLKNGANPDIPGDAGMTALYFCAAFDNIECAKILIDHKADMTKACPNGFFPIHVAATKGSAIILKYLLDEGGKRGCSKRKMLSFADGDNNKPLHTAVQFGNTSAISLLMENGARIDEVIDVDQTTPVHIACAQGSLDILKLMFEKQPELKDEVIHMQDMHLMTPLHKASMFDHVDVVEYMIECGADINACDKEKRTALLLAASRNCTKVVCFLISKNADIKARDSKFRNLLHLIVSNQSASLKLLKDSEYIYARSNAPSIQKSTSNDDYATHGSSTPDSAEKSDVDQAFESLNEVTKELFKRPKFSELYDEQDIDGSTVMHYASKLGHVGSLRALIQFGANIAMKNHEKQSPLHIAAKYGRYNSCMQILSSPKYKSYLNDRDGSGFTPLHLAAQNGHSKVVKLLMERGALIFKAFNGNTAFHEAAQNSHIGCMSTVLGIEAKVLDVANKDQDTALHIAAQEGHANVVEYLLNANASFTKNKDELTFVDIAIAQKHHSVLLAIIGHDRWQEALNLTSKPYKIPFLGMIEYSSEVTQAVLERCIIKKDIDGSNGKAYSITYNFKYLTWSDEIVNSRGKTELVPLLPLSYMVRYGRTDCLSHQLCEIMLKRKWNRYGLPIYSFAIGLYILFLVMLTLIVTTYPTCLHSDVFDHYSNLTKTNCYISINDPDSTYHRFQNIHVYTILAIICIVYSFLDLCHTVLQFYIERLAYVRNVQNFVQTITSTATIAFCIPFIFRAEFMLHYQWEAASVAIFAAWFNLLLYMQRSICRSLNQTKSVDPTKIMHTLFKVIALFSILIIAFSLVFFILLQNESARANSTPFISIIRTVTMMIGELDSLDQFIGPLTDDSKFTLHYAALTIVFLMLFIVLVPILLTNLLIGLAVGDIESIQKNAKLKREAMQVQLHIDLESKMPKSIWERFNENEYTVIHSDAFQKSCFGIISYIFENFDSPSDMNTNDEDDDNLIYMEMLKQKQRLNLIKTQMDQQTELLRMIVKKMEIKNDDDDDDNDVDDRATSSFDNIKEKKNTWGTNISNTRLRNLVLQRMMTRKGLYSEETN